MGVDWKEELGVMYYLTNTLTQEMIHVKVATADRETPRLHSVSDIWAVANFQEREVYDFYGIEFINHPDMRRFFLRNDWVGFPLRKDYDDNPELNPLRLDDEKNEDDTYRLVEDEDGNITRIDGKVFEEDEYVVNVGPQHPSTHGVMRYRASIEGELVKKVDVVSGYIHRGIEKMCESLTYPQTLLYTERLDYMSAHINRHCLCLCIEKAMGIEVPHRAAADKGALTNRTQVVLVQQHRVVDRKVEAFGCKRADADVAVAAILGHDETLGRILLEYQPL